MSEPDVLAYLHKKGLHTRVASRDEVHLPCFWHGEDPSDRGRLYVNVSGDPATNGLYFCQVCGQKGNLITLMRHFGDELPREQDDDRWYIRQEILNHAADHYHGNLQPEHVKWLREERGLTSASIQKYRIGWADGTLYRHLRDADYELADMVKTGLIVLQNDNDGQDNTLVLDAHTSKPYDFLRDCISIPYFVAGNCVQVRGKKMDGKYLTPPRQEARLFNTDSVWNTDVCVITEGEFDCMVTEQLGFPAVATPGAKAWQDSWTGYFDSMRRTYLLFDNDAAGQLGADAVKEKLGRKARSVLMPFDGLTPGKNDISEYFGKNGHDAEEFSTLLRKADRAGSLLVTVDEAVEEWETLQGLPGFRYGFDEFDDYMKPGQQAGTVWVVLAKTNVGKTLTLLNVFQRSSMIEEQKDSKILFVSLEQTRGDWFERARRIWNFYNLDCPAPDLNSETANYWRNRIRLTDVNRMNIESLVSTIDDFTEEMGQLPDLVAIDYLGYWARSFKGVSKYEQVSEAVMSLKEVSKERLVRVLAPHQVSRSQEFGKEIELDSGRDSGAIEETADGVFTLWNPDTTSGRDTEERTGRIHLKIGKTRAGNKGRVAYFQFGYLTLVMVPLTDTENVRLATAEMEYDNRDDMSHIVNKWEAAIFRHRSGIKHGDISKHLLLERGSKAEQVLLTS